MKTVTGGICVLLLLSASAWPMALGSSARSVIPSDIQQIISVDYRALKNSDTAMALKQQVLPPSLKEFEVALRGVGIDPDRDVEQLTFASYRSGKQGVRIVGIAQGQFPTATVLKKMRLNKVRPLKLRNIDIYPMASGMQMTFLDDSTLLFGDSGAVRGALDTRDGYSYSMDSNNQIADMIGAVDSGMVWSVLDQQGTQNMLHSALGDAAALADYETIKKRILGSRYTMNFQNGVNFDLDVVTSDSVTATTLSSLLRAGVLYKKMTATPVEKLALDSMTVNSDSSNLQMHFKADDKQFQSLLHSPLFAAVSK
ncbi:MAG TPA: hypothetical protein VN868_10815 [Terriglobales bacterium]|jgi:hypothetical protein|nr:hypothetical protein [Terriglobales bacterium]